MRPVVVLGASVLAAVACTGTTPTSLTRTAVPPVESCSGGTLTTGPALTGALGPLQSCRVTDPATGELSWAVLYALPLVAGKGYLVTMSGSPLGTPNPQLELVAPGISHIVPPSSATADTLLAMNRTVIPGQAQLLFASGTTTTDSVRAMSADSALADTGAFTITLQACKSPLSPITDSVTHTDTLTIADCEVDLGEFYPAPPAVFGSANVHLYDVHVAQQAVQLPLTFTATAKIRFYLGGPHDDTFSTVGNSEVVRLDSATANASFMILLGGPADYTLVMATDPTDSPNGAVYTLTVGTPQPMPAVSRNGPLRSLGHRE